MRTCAYELFHTNFNAHEHFSNEHMEDEHLFSRTIFFHYDFFSFRYIFFIGTSYPTNVFYLDAVWANELYFTNCSHPTFLYANSCLEPPRTITRIHTYKHIHTYIHTYIHPPPRLHHFGFTKCEGSCPGLFACCCDVHHRVNKYHPGPCRPPGKQVTPWTRKPPGFHLTHHR